VESVDVCMFSIWVRWEGGVENLEYYTDLGKKGEM
jgi:hypothetical protein